MSRQASTAALEPFCQRYSSASGAKRAARLAVTKYRLACLLSRLCEITSLQGTWVGAEGLCSP